MLGAVCAPVLLGLLPGMAVADLIDTTVKSTDAQKRSCIARPASGAGVIQRTTTASADGLVRARLSGQGSGDWDLAVFDKASGDRVAGSASYGLSELAEGVAAKDQVLLVQACRRSGPTDSVALNVRSIPLPAPTGETIRLVRVALPTPGSRDALDATGLDQTEHATKTSQDVMLYSAAEALKLTRAGLAYTVVTPDVVAADRKALSAASPTDVEPMPSGRTSYRHLADFQADMKALVEENPSLVKPVTLNHPSLEGRSVEGIELSKDVAQSDGKPVFLQMGVHHAREWPAAEMPMEWAIDLVKSFNAGDERVVDLLSQARVIMVPVVNPDGFNLSREAPIDSQQPVVDPSFAYKRRNCRIQDFQLPAPGECGLQSNRNLGVDPNRNYGGLWGGGGAGLTPTDDTYRGAGPFSEPETQNVRELVSSRQVTTLITNHTYSDLVLRPPGLRAQGDPPDEPVYKQLGDAMAAENGYTSQKSYELYDTSGTTEDWSYYATGGLGFTFEIGKASEESTLVGVGFHPAYPVGVIAEYHGKQPGGGGNREAYFKALESTASSARHAILEGTAAPGSTLTLHKEFKTATSPVIQADGSTKDPILIDDVLDTTLTVGPSGRFEWHVNPSTRPAVAKAKTTSEVSPAPAQSIDISSAEPALPPAAGGTEQVGTRDFEFDVSPAAARQIRAQIDGADGDDYDLYLYKGTKAPENIVASSASSTADETIALDYPEPGHYVLSVQNWLATSGWTGTLEVFGAVPGSETTVPAGIEPWNVTCDPPGGRPARSEQIVIDRGQRKAVTACDPGARKPRAATTKTGS